MHYEKYPNSKEVSSRLTRKQQRRSIYVKNKKIADVVRKERRLARKAALEAEEENTGE